MYYSVSIAKSACQGVCLCAFVYLSVYLLLMSIYSNDIIIMSAQIKVMEKEGHKYGLLSL